MPPGIPSLGISSLQRSALQTQSYSTLSSTLSSQSLSHLHSQLNLFQTSLKNFSSTHRKQLLSNPEYRHLFSEMCAELGVDPLGGGGGGREWWSALGMGEWMNELAVQVVDVCLMNRELDGGLTDLDDVVKGVNRLRDEGPSSGSGSLKKSNGTGKEKDKKSSAEPYDEVTREDVIRAIKVLQPLGCGYEIVTLPSTSLDRKSKGRKMVRSVPGELDTDILLLLECADAFGKGWITHRVLESHEGWSRRRVDDVVDKALMRDGIVWVDDKTEDDEDEGGKGEKKFWVVGMFDLSEDRKAPPVGTIAGDEEAP